MTAERLATLRRDDLAGVLVVASSGRDPDLAPFVAGARLGRSLLVVPARRDPALGYFTPMEREEAAVAGLRLLTPELLEVQRATRESATEGQALAWILGRALLAAGIDPGKLALAGSLGAGWLVEATRSLEADGWSFVSGHELLRRARKSKSDDEVAAIAAVARATAGAIRSLAGGLAAAVEAEGELWLGGSPLTVGRLRCELAVELARAGFDQPEGCIVAPAEEGAVPHTSGAPERRVRSGQSLVVDVFPRGRLFADCTRTFCVGSPPEALRLAHGEVREALSAARSATRSGAVGWDLQRMVCERFAAAGYATPIGSPGSVTGYVHGLGHGVGFELHELPSFRENAGDTGVLEVGDVLTLEPGLYDPQAGYGVRLEDTLVVRGEGVECLTVLPYELDPGAYV
jgi:Xaa-Pro aminopeptidase